MRGSKGEEAEGETLGSDAGSGSDFESWLRKAARDPEGPARVALPQVGQVVGGKYRIEEQLGRGGMGAVYRATHTVSGKSVALKWMLRPASDERAQQRFTREARAAGRIDHPNVVDVYDIGQEGEAGYLVMELLRGESLRTRLARGPLGPTEAVDLLLPAMKGVAAAHREGVIHRDIKPDNVFLCAGPDGAAREAKVLDFGISSITAPDFDSQTTLTKEGTVLGTPTYMSPEQLQSSKDADARSDVYAFGVILYEALAGAVPFQADSYSALVLAIANTTARALRELRPEIPVALERVVMRAMERDKNVRFQSMDELVAALLPFASIPSAGSGEHVSVEMQRPAAPGRGGLVTGLAAGVIAVLALLAWWLGRDDAVPEPSVAPEAATESSGARVVAEIAPETTPQSAPASTPAPAPAAGSVAVPEPAPEMRAAAPPLDAVEPAARKKLRRGVSAPTASAPPPDGTPKLAPTKAPRSGKIALDDL